MEFGKQTFAQLLVACGAAFYALSGILSRNLRDLPKLQSSAAILLVASLFIVPAALIIDRPWMLVPDGSAIGAIVVLGLLSTALAQIIVLGILQLRDASFLSLNNYFVPLFGVFWGVLVLAERPGPNTAIAFLVILAGVFVSQGGLRLLVRRRSRA
jgi:drug/metabolite transporter (DMT)-like permease